MSKTGRSSVEITQVALLSAVNIASRVYMQFLPNVKPVTSILMVTTALLGPRVAIEVATTTVLVSSLLLGMGPWTVSQITAWYTIIGITALTQRHPLTRSQPAQALLAFISGYIFGLLVSLEKLLYGGPHVYIAYWLSGLPFDTLHAIGNLIFHPICNQIMRRALSIRTPNPVDKNVRG